MSRLSINEYRNGRLINGYDYDEQLWVKGGKYISCGHPEDMDCGCHGRLHAGKKTPVKKRKRFNATAEDYPATDQEIIDALKASVEEKDKLIEHLSDRLDSLHEQLNAALAWRGCHG